MTNRYLDDRGDPRLAPILRDVAIALAVLLLLLVVPVIRELRPKASVGVP